MFWPLTPRLRRVAVLAFLVVLAGAAVAVYGAGPARSAPAGRTARGVAGPVVLLGTGGLRWEDVDDDTPALSAALGRDAVADLAVRSVREVTCPVDGWLAVSAGRRAADTPAPTSPTGCRTPQAELTVPGGSAQADRWAVYRGAAATDGFGADPGLVGSALGSAGVSAAAVGPGAVIALANRQGRTDRAWPGLPTGPDGTLDPGGDAVGLSHQVTAAVASGARVIVVDLGAIRDVRAARDTAPDTAPGQPGTGPPTRQEQVQALDTRLALVQGALPSSATVIVASLADSGTPAHLQAIMARGPGTGTSFTAGLLGSASTRQAGLVQTTDLAPTVFDLLGVPAPVELVGSPLTWVPDGDEADRLQHLLDLDQATLTVDGLVTPVFIVLGLIDLILLAGLALLAVRTRRPAVRRRALIGAQLAGVALALVPVATFGANLWPWWRSSVPGVALATALVAVVVPLTAIAFAGPWRRPLLGPAGVAGALVVVLLGLDLATGSRLELVALIGGEPIVAGRFYGLSNPTFALFATGALFAALALAQALLQRGRPRWTAGVAVAAVGVVATAIDGLPALGSDFGGPPAIVPAFGLLALWVAGVRITWRRAAAIGLLTAGVLALIAGLDWLRPPSARSHLGRFVQSLIDGDGILIIERKLAQNLGLLVSTPLTLSVPLAAAAAVVLLRRPARWHLTGLQAAYRREPLLPAGLVALGGMLLLGFLANDTGTAIPPAALPLFGPLLFAISARAVQLDDAEQQERTLRAVVREVRRQ